MHNSKEVVAVDKQIPRLTVLETTTSTNDVCKELACQGAADGTAVQAYHQTAGRGRLGRSFQSPKGLGLYLSILWRPACTPEQLLPLTSLVAVAAAKAVEQVSGAEVGIKWPNDLVLRGKKLSGILTEGIFTPDGQVDYVIAGIGINCHHRREDFDGEVADIATSLDMVTKNYVNQKALAEELLKQLDVLRSEVFFAPEKWLADYRRRCITLGKTVKIVQSGEVVTAVDVDEQYGLIVEADGQRTTYRSGEVSVRGLYGYTE